MGDYVRHVRGTAHDDAKSSCTPCLSTVRRSAAAPELLTAYDPAYLDTVCPKYRFYTSPDNRMADQHVVCESRRSSTFLEKSKLSLKNHDDVIKWKYFPCYWPFVRGIHRSLVNSPHKGQWRGALMFSLICAWINGGVKNGEVGDLRRHRVHDDVIVMIWERVNTTLKNRNLVILITNPPQTRL